MLRPEMPGADFSEEERLELKQAAHAALARKDYLAYATFIDPGYKVVPHIQLLGSYLNAVERGDIRKLAVTVPPRHGKSEATSGKFPGWCLGKDLSRTVMITSYAASLAETFSLQNRDTISSNPRWKMVFPDVNLNPNVRGREKWALAGQRESVIAAGVGGSITGLGAWLLLIDDPVKNYEEAVSQARQEAVWNWYTTTARTRLTPDGRIIIIMTRWAEGDLLGRALENDPEFVVLHLPAFSYGTTKDYIELYPDASDRAKVIETLPTAAFPDPLGRPKGEALWPERFNNEFLREQAEQLGHSFESLYQGNPSAPEGNKFQRSWFRSIPLDILTHLPSKPIAKIRSYDLAWSGKERADYTAGLKATLYKNKIGLETRGLPKHVQNWLKTHELPPVMLVIEDVTRWRAEWPETAEKIIQTAIEDGDGIKIILEAVATQNVAIRSLKSDLRLWKHSLTGLPVKGDKEARANFGLALAERGLVFILHESTGVTPEWEMGFLNELAAFPSARNDDQVDAYTQIVNHLQPHIDGALALSPYRRGEWSTPFMGQDKEAKQRHLPSEFRERDHRSAFSHDRLGWCK